MLMVMIGANVQIAGESRDERQNKDADENQAGFSPHVFTLTRSREQFKAKEHQKRQLTPPTGWGAASRSRPDGGSGIG